MSGKKFCKDCRNAMIYCPIDVISRRDPNESDWVAPGVEKFAICVRDAPRMSEPSLVSGQTTLIDIPVKLCADERGLSGGLGEDRCGPEGRHFFTK